MTLVLYNDEKEIVDVFVGGIVNGDSIAVNGESVGSVSGLGYIYVPQQPIVTHVNKGGKYAGITIDSLIHYGEGGMLEEIDANTELAINSAAHTVSPIGEQIGILRDQLVQIINALGLSPTDDFARLNEIAIAEIEKAQIEKEAL